MKTRLESPFKGDNLKALVKRQIGKTWSFISLRKFRKMQPLLCFFWFSVTKQSFKMVLASHNNRKYPRYLLVLKLNITLVWPLRLVILYFFKWKTLSDDRCLYLHDSK